MPSTSSATGLKEFAVAQDERLKNNVLYKNISDVNEPVDAGDSAIFLNTLPA